MIYSTKTSWKLNVSILSIEVSSENINVIGWKISSIMSADVSKLLKKIEADDVKFIRLQFTDVPGIPKNAAIPVDYTEKSLTEGTWFDGSSIEGFTRIEESDMLL